MTYFASIVCIFVVLYVTNLLLASGVVVNTKHLPTLMTPTYGVLNTNNLISYDNILFHMKLFKPPSGIEPETSSLQDWNSNH